MTRAFAFALGLCLLITPQLARAASLSEVLRLDETIEIMRAEGLSYGENLAEDLFPDSSAIGWDAEVSRIYAPERMVGALEAALETVPADAQETLVTFFESEVGQRIIRLEITAREALLNDAVEEASLENLRRMIVAEDPRLDQIERYSDANDLVNENVVGALNANYAFYQGLREGGALPFDMSDDEILADVWSQEDGIRTDTTEWVMSYLAMAYQPLSDDDLDAYIDIAESEAGQALNRALFDGFDILFKEISRDLGESASKYLVGEDI